MITNVKIDKMIIQIHTQGPQEMGDSFTPWTQLRKWDNPSFHLEGTTCLLSKAKPWWGYKGLSLMALEDCARHNKADTERQKLAKQNQMIRHVLQRGIGSSSHHSPHLTPSSAARSSMPFSCQLQQGLLPEKQQPLHGNVFTQYLFIILCPTAAYILLSC